MDVTLQAPEHGCLQAACSKPYTPEMRNALPHKQGVSRGGDLQVGDPQQVLGPFVSLCVKGAEREEWRGVIVALPCAHMHSNVFGLSISRPIVNTICS